MAYVEVEVDAEAGDELVVGNFYGFGHTIFSSSYCVSGDIISSTIGKGDAMVTSDY